MKIFALILGLSISSGLYASEEQSCDLATLQNSDGIDVAQVNLQDNTLEILADIPLVFVGHTYPTVVKGHYLLNHDYESNLEWPIGCQGGGLEFLVESFPVGNDDPQDLEQMELVMVCYQDSLPNQIFRLASGSCSRPKN